MLNSSAPRGCESHLPASLYCKPLESLDGHPDIRAVAEHARRRIGSLSGQAVYDILDAFTEAGLVRPIQPAGRPALFETRVGDNHHHLICRRGKTIVDVDCAMGAAPCLEPSTTANFAIDKAEVVFWGICPGCAALRDPQVHTEPARHPEGTPV